MWIKVQTKARPQFHQEILHSRVPFAVQNSLVIRDDSLEVVGNVRFVRIQSTKIVNLLIVDVHFNIVKNWVQNVLYMSNERNWCLLFHRLFLIRFCLFFLPLLSFVASVNFVTTTPDKFQLQSRVRLSQINIIVPIRLKFKVYAVSIEWGTRIDFLFMGWQDIVDYWYFPPRFPDTATEGWYRKLLDMNNDKRKRMNSFGQDWRKRFLHLWENDWNTWRVERFCVFIVQNVWLFQPFRDIKFWGNGSGVCTITWSIVCTWRQVIQ